MLKRPKWVWTIFIFYLASAIWTILSFYIILHGTISLPPQHIKYFYNLTTVDWIISMIQPIITLIAALTLFKLKKITTLLWLTSLITGILSHFYFMLSSSWIETLGTQKTISTIIGLSIISMVFLYTKNLAKKDILK